MPVGCGSRFNCNKTCVRICERVHCPVLLRCMCTETSTQSHTEIDTHAQTYRQRRRETEKKLGMLVIKLLGLLSAYVRLTVTIHRIEMTIHFQRFSVYCSQNWLVPTSSISPISRSVPVRPRSRLAISLTTDLSRLAVSITTD